MIRYILFLATKEVIIVVVRWWKIWVRFFDF
jgi:hypothetical protein